MSEKKLPPAGKTGGFNRAYNPANTHSVIYPQTGKSQVREQKYRDALGKLPQRGGGLHGALMALCNFGVAAGISEPVLLQEITATGRAFRRGEVAEAITKAMREAGQTPRHPVKTSAKEFTEALAPKAEAIRARIIELGGNSIAPDSADLWECSNPHPGAFPLSGGMDGSECAADVLSFLQELYRPDDVLYIGSGYEPHQDQPNHIKTAADWIKFFAAELDAIRQEQNEREQCYALRRLGLNYPFVIANPLTGTPTEEGSYRTGKNVKEFRYIVAECDGMPLDKQLALICGSKLPVCSLTYSGGKSIHALLDAGQPITSLDDWNRIVKNTIFPKLDLLGFDPATSNPDRLTRLPGMWRQDKDRFQALLYINRKGGAICLTK